jgi:hypothetical protein
MFFYIYCPDPRKNLPSQLGRQKTARQENPNSVFKNLDFFLNVIIIAKLVYPTTKQSLNIENCYPKKTQPTLEKPEFFIGITMPN